MSDPGYNQKNRTAGRPDDTSIRFSYLSHAPFPFRFPLKLVAA
jgi:hypothetical protein